MKIIIVGSGIIGLTTAFVLLRSGNSKYKIILLEKEPSFGVHASGRNSGILHCGVYYPNDTMKARFCQIGSQMMRDYADSKGIKYNQTGKLILSTNDDEYIALKKLELNAINNKISYQIIKGKEVLDIEPFGNPDSIALHCPTTAVINPKDVLHSLFKELKEKGVDFRFNTEVLELRNNTAVTNNGIYNFDYLINCSGSHADKLAKQQNLATDFDLVPFKGIYLKLSKKDNYKVRSNIYPVPNINLPFLGVHLTRTMDNEVYIGPTAIPAFGRENYGLLSGLNVVEASNVTKNLIKLYAQNTNNFRTLAHLEFSKYIKSNFISAAKRLMPTIDECEIISTPKVGIRPQLVNTKTNKLEMDYKLEKTDNSLHVLNAISPAFTCSFAFAEDIVAATGL